MVQKNGGHSVWENTIFMPKFAIFCENCPQNYKFVKMHANCTNFVSFLCKICYRARKRGVIGCGLKEKGGHWVYDWHEKRGAQ